MGLPSWDPTAWRLIDLTVDTYLHTLQKELHSCTVDVYIPRNHLTTVVIGKNDFG